VKEIKKFIFKSTEKLIVLAFSGFIIIAVMGYLAWENQKTFENTIVTQTQQQLLATAKSVALNIEFFFEMQQGILKSLATDPILSRLTPDMDFEQLKMRYMELKGDIGGFYLISSKGIVTHRYPHKNRVGKDFANKAGISIVLKTHKPYISKLFISDSGRTCLSVLEPIFSGEKFNGIIRTLIYVSTIQKKYVASVAVTKSGTVHVLNNKGIVIMHPKVEYIGENSIVLNQEDLSQYERSQVENIVGKMMDGQKGVGIYHSVLRTSNAFEKVKKLTGYAPVHIGSQLWSVGISTDFSEISAPIKANFKNHLGIAGFLVLLFGTGGFVLYKTQRKKNILEEKTKHFEAIAEIAENLKESEEKYRSMMDAMIEPSYICTNDFHIAYMNRSMIKRTGYDATGGLCYKTLHNLDEPCSWCIHDKIQEGKSFELEILSPMDNRYYQTSHAPIFHSDGSISKMTIYKDISEKKQADAIKTKLETQLQQSQKMEAIGTLAGGVAHDLNNVLSAQVGYPDLILMDLPENSPLKEPILRIQESGQKAAAIVQDLLTLARRGVVVADVMNLNKLVDSYINSPEYAKLKLFHPYAIIRSNLDVDLLNIMGSTVHLFKTIMNLVSNAAEAIPDGGNITISTQNQYIDKPVKGYNTINEGDYTVLKVSDTGIGIASKDIERIFEPFYTKKVMGRSGTGLGMAVVWGTVQDHKGYVDVQSTLNEGTTFTLYFPVTRKEINEKETAIPLEEYMGNGESILVVDDVEGQRKIASDLLKKLGYSVISVASGEHAVDYMKENSADLIILDMIMDPGIDGCETYKRILELHPEQKAIITSGFSESDKVKETQRLGAGEYIKKPYLFEKIGVAVKEELGN